jgi:hypothetical protein
MIYLYHQILCSQQVHKEQITGIYTADGATSVAELVALFAADL